MWLEQELVSHSFKADCIQFKGSHWHFKRKGSVPPNSTQNNGNTNIFTGVLKVLSPTRKETSQCSCQNDVNFLLHLALRGGTWWQLTSPFCWNRTCPWHASKLVSFLVGLRTYQHPGILYIQPIPYTHKTYCSIHGITSMCYELPKGRTREITIMKLRK